MEIIFELEDSDLEIDFTPDFDWMYKKHPGKNRADYSKVQWELGKENVEEQYLALCSPEGDA